MTFETPIYDSLGDVVQAIEDGELDKEEVTVRIDNDFVQTYRDDPETFNHDYPDAIISEIDQQVLSNDDQLPRGVLQISKARTC